MPKRTCTYGDCDKPHSGRGFCRSHYYQMRRDGKFVANQRLTLEQRFWPKVDKNGPLPEERPDLGNCWVWKSAKHDSVYGAIIDKAPPMTPAHRAGYELMVGPIPNGLVLDHLCRRPRCVRFDHLEPVPQPVNIARGKAPALLREWDAKGRALTHCKWGHEYTQANTRIKKNGTRSCKACALKANALRAKRPENREYLNALARKNYAERIARRRAEAA